MYTYIRSDGPVSLSAYKVIQSKHQVHVCDRWAQDRRQVFLVLKKKSQFCFLNSFSKKKIRILIRIFAIIIPCTLDLDERLYQRCRLCYVGECVGHLGGMERVGHGSSEACAHVVGRLGPVFDWLFCSRRGYCTAGVGWRADGVALFG